MPVPPEPKKDQPNTYVVQSNLYAEELRRLTIQDELMTTLMGGPLNEQTGAASMRRVLDIGSGSGSWVLTTAKTYPEMSLIGIDISQRMVDYARQQTSDQQLADRVEFHVMDALLMLEFPNDYFDLVNLRFGVGYLRTWDWPKLLSEMLRVCRPGGIVRFTESAIGDQGGPAVTQVYDMLTCALFRSGHLFEQTRTSLIENLVPLLTRHGCQNVHSQTRVAATQAGTPEAEAAKQDIIGMCRVSRPFLEKWGCLPDNYDAFCQQVIEETQDPNFTSSTTVLTAWGNKPATTPRP
jgi:ubiquinone/menaquinone biosynthesis C-methylase UbiE